MFSTSSLSSIKLSSGCELNLFQKTDNSHISKSMRYIVNMIELNYIKASEGSFMFTNSGIEYMNRCHREFANNLVGKKIDFGDMRSLVMKMAAPKIDHGMKLHENQSLLNDTDDVDYNNVRLQKNTEIDDIQA